LMNTLADLAPPPEIIDAYSAREFLAKKLHGAASNGGFSARE
jgi:hypothetical protein